jgi:hypothetical protein
MGSSATADALDQQMMSNAVRCLMAPSCLDVTTAVVRGILLRYKGDFKQAARKPARSIGFVMGNARAGRLRRSTDWLVDPPPHILRVNEPIAGTET